MRRCACCWWGRSRPAPVAGGIDNLPPAAVEAPRAAPALFSRTEEPALVEAGRAAYEAQGCGMCHSIGGIGNPRYPLDGVGARLRQDEIRKWIVGAREREGRLPAGAFRMKQSYQALPREEMDALVAYMQSLRFQAVRQNSLSLAPVIW